MMFRSVERFPDLRICGEVQGLTFQNCCRVGISRPQGIGMP